MLLGAEDQRPFGADQGVDRLTGAESLPQAVGFNCGFAHHASPFLLCRGSRSGGDRHDTTLDI